MMADRYQAFQQLHRSGCFVIPNPWDVGTARALQKLGFKALATTSSGFAWSQGLPDNQVALESVLRHLDAIVGSVELPVSADFEACFAVEPDGVYDNVSLALKTGICGVSIEDSTQNANAPLFDLPAATDRVRAARQAIDDFGKPAVLTARYEGLLLGVGDINDAKQRLIAYAAAGADCLYAPAVRADGEIESIVRAVEPKAVNVLVSANFTSVERLAELGVRRISVGGSLARCAWTSFLEAARAIAVSGSFSGLDGLATNAMLNKLHGEEGRS